MSCRRVEGLVNLARSLSDVDESLTGNDNWLERLEWAPLSVQLKMTDYRVMVRESRAWSYVTPPSLRF